MTPDYAELAKHIVEYLQAAAPLITAGFGTGLGKATGERLFKSASDG